nr:MAG TPA: hypothetical protein [Crassvirales sp.]
MCKSRGKYPSPTPCWLGKIHNSAHFLYSISHFTAPYTSTLLFSKLN